MTAYEEDFRNLWDTYVSRREGTAELLKWMEQEGFFAAPASASHHLNHPGGLCKHTVNVAYNALDLRMGSRKFYSMNPAELVTAALLHDLCKIGKYKAVEGDTSAYVHSDRFLLGHGEESVILAQQFIKLTENERLAIRWHMGAYTGERDWDTLSKVYDRCPMALLLHFADMMATHCDEVEHGT